MVLALVVRSEQRCWRRGGGYKGDRSPAVADRESTANELFL